MSSNLEWDASLRGRTTLRVDARVRCLATVADAASLPAVLEEPSLRDLPVLVLGEGSNVLFATGQYDGLVVHLAGGGARLGEADDEHALVHVGAAESWDALVSWTLAHGLQGLENLALIPGQCGAAPIQNIGAYGAEVGDCVEAVHTYDRIARATRTFTRAECAFGYRDSVFKREPDRHVVTGLSLKLARRGESRLGYAGVREELAALGLTPTPANVATAVRSLRRRKLPDPAVIGNAGSFFKNPVVAHAQAAELAERWPGCPVYPAGDDAHRKLSAAWLIERAGWRGFREGDAGISAQHALVLVNHGAATGAELLSVARRVSADVERRFGVRLEPEPRIVGAEF